MVREGLGVAQSDVDGLPVILRVEYEGVCKRLLSEKLDEFGALEGHLGELPAEVVLDH